MSASTPPDWARFSFRRIVDIPFATCTAALDSGQLTGPGGSWRAGRPLACGPAEHDPDTGTCRIQVRLARGPLRPPLLMRLQADQWSDSPPRTALELTPCGPVRPSAASFRAGHLLLDWLVRSLARPGTAQLAVATRADSQPLGLLVARPGGLARGYHRLDAEPPGATVVPAPQRATRSTQGGNHELHRNAQRSRE